MGKSQHHHRIGCHLHTSDPDNHASQVSVDRNLFASKCAARAIVCEFSRWSTIYLSEWLVFNLQVTRTNEQYNNNNNNNLRSYLVQWQPTKGTGTTAVLHR